jgi:U3 small nucleolar RNA-associated protein 13
MGIGTNIRIYISFSSCVAVLDGHASVVRGLTFTDDGQYLISGGRDQILNVWDLDTQEIVQTIPVHEVSECANETVIE